MILPNLKISIRMNLSLVWEKVHVRISPYSSIVETPATTSASPSSGKKPAPIPDEDRFEPESMKTKDDEAVIIDDEDDDATFDDEEFETVIAQSRAFVLAKFSSNLVGFILICHSVHA